MDGGIFVQCLSFFISAVKFDRAQGWPATKQVSGPWQSYVRLPARRRDNARLRDNKNNYILHLITIFIVCVKLK